jgi:hypothetical protein
MSLTMSGSIPAQPAIARRGPKGSRSPRIFAMKNVIPACAFCVIVVVGYLEHDKLTGTAPSTPEVAAREVAAREVAAREVAAHEVAAREVAAREVAAREPGPSAATATPDETGAQGSEIGAPAHEIECYTPVDPTVARNVGNRNAPQTGPLPAPQGETKAGSTAESETTNSLVALGDPSPAEAAHPTAQARPVDAVLHSNPVPAKPPTNDAAKPEMNDHAVAAKVEPVEAAKPAAFAGKIEAPKAAQVVAGNCSLNFNSIPASRVRLDGQEIGSTPKVGVAVAPGSHVVMFVTDEIKKMVSATCAAGEQKTVAMRLTQ